MGVANTNSQDVSAHFCIGYMPELAGQGKAFYSTKWSTSVKFYIRQEATAAVFRVLEGAARSGVLCPYTNVIGEHIQLLLYPRLLSVPIDSKEAQLFFGMKNRMTCSKCTRCPGYSAFRKASMQDVDCINRLYAFAAVEKSPWFETETQQLAQYGFNSSRRCKIPLVCKHLLVRVPSMPNAVFPCADFRDKMHGMFIFLHKRMNEALDMITWPVGADRRSVKYMLDQRLLRISGQRTVSTDNNTRAIRTQRSVFNDAGMSAADRVTHLCLLPYVFGHEGIIIPANVRQELLLAIATTQKMVVAAGGN